MKILSIHSDFLEFEPKSKALKTAEEAEKAKKRVDECLVIFTSVEKGDSEEIVNDYIDEVLKLSDQVKSKRIVLYPWVHLSQNPSEPSVALSILKEAEKQLKEKGFDVTRAPFGWYKSFIVSCKGHPLSELSREIKHIKKEESEALKAESKIVSYWNILDTDGKMYPISIDGNKIKGFDFSKFKNLEKFCMYEMAKSRKVDKEPAHIKIMRELELIDYEPGSDPGNFRFYPKGFFIKSLLEDYVNQRVVDYGAMQIETPIMYDLEHPTLKKYLNRFPARQYTVQSPNKKLFLRFAACFGQFLMAHDATISYKHLPMRFYEMSHYSFRAEQRGELAGMRRLRTFTMPDCHALCLDLEQAKEEMLTRFKLSKSIQMNIGFDMPNDLEFAIRVVKPFWNENQEYVKELVKEYGKPALVEMWDERFFYFIMKYEWNFVDSLNKAAALNTDQIDIENAETYDINYIDKDGKKKKPYILHLSPSGAIERVIYGLLEKAYFDSQKGKQPQLPLWLSPTQIRLIPVSEDQLKYCEELFEKFENVRVDIDDTNESLGKKIRNAEKEWIPYIVVIGSKEVESGELAVRVRNEGQKEFSVDSLVFEIHEKTKGMPFKQLPLSKLVSKRPIFVG